MQTEKHLTIFQDKGYMIWVNKKEIPSKSQVSIHKCIWFCKRTIPLFLSDRTPIGVKYLRISIESEEAHWIKGETSSQTEKKSSCLQWQHLMVVVLQHTDNNYHQPDVMKILFLFVCFFTPKSVYFSEFYLNLLLYRIVWNLDEQTYDTEQLQTELMPDPMPETQILAVSSVNFTLIPSATLFLQKW